MADPDDTAGAQGPIKGPAVMTAALGQGPLSGTVFGRYLETCTIAVGPRQILFTVHYGLLRERCLSLAAKVYTDTGGEHCTYPVNASAGDAPHPNTIFLPELAVAAFRIFLVWLYTDHLAPPSDSSPNRDDPKNEDDDPSVQERLVTGKTAVHHIRDRDLIQLFSFAQTYNLRKLSNLSMSVLAQQNFRRNRTTSKDAVDLAFQAPTLHKSLCDMLAEEAALRLSPSTLTNNLSNFHPDYVLQAMRIVLLDRTKSESGRMSNGKWFQRVDDLHNHLDEVEAAYCAQSIQCNRSKNEFASQMHDWLDDTVSVLVGFDQIRFTVHRGLVCRYSEYFRGAFEGNFVEGQKQEVLLNQESAKDFALFLSWLYGQVIYLPTMDEHKIYDQYLLELRSSSTTQKMEAAGQASLKETSCEAGERHADSEPAADGLDSSETATNVAADGATASIQAENEAADGSPKLEGSRSGQEETLDSDPDDDSEDDDSEDDDSEDHEASKVWESKTQDCLVDLFIFADRRGVSQLRNSLIDLFAEQRESGWPLLSAATDRVGIAYSCLPAFSALSRYLIHEAAWCWDHDFRMINNLDDYPTEFTARVLKCVLRYSRRKGETYRPQWRLNICSLHHHVNGKEKLKCQAEKKAWHVEMKAKGEMEPVK